MEELRKYKLCPYCWHFFHYDNTCEAGEDINISESCCWFEDGSPDECLYSNS